MFPFLKTLKCIFMFAVTSMSWSVNCGAEKVNCVRPALQDTITQGRFLGFYVCRYFSLLLLLFLFNLVAVLPNVNEKTLLALKVQ